MDQIHGSIQEQKLLSAVAKELKKYRECAVIYARGGRPPYVNLMVMSHVHVLTRICEEAGVLKEVEALIKEANHE